MFTTAFRDHLNGEATTVAYCWKLTSTAGKMLGFTNHDQSLFFAGTAYTPGIGADGTQALAQADFQAGQQEALGILSSDDLSEQDLTAGLWDNAQVEVYLVNWQEPEAQHHLLRRGALGEVSRDASIFRAEFRSIAARLSETKGRQLSHQCHADLGDSKCGVDLTSPAYMKHVSIIRQEGSNRLVIEGQSDVSAGWWSHGKLTFVAGPYINHPLRILNHSKEEGLHKVALWAPLVLEQSFPVSAKVFTGCDKSWGTCQAKFQNSDSFRGFPHMPGNDFILAGPASQSGANNGAKLVG